ncbi:MAG: hypothetical protein IKK21_05745 [Clostridia bacterium]|nr:hypothetical protein [Clostridia bacterium]
MIAGLYLACYLLCGAAIVRWLLPGHRPLNRLWLGLSLGVLMMMWLPALMAFATDFTMTAHMLALLPLAGLTAGAYFLRDRRTPRAWDEEESRQAYQIALVVLPLTILSAYLQYTHVMRVGADGSWNVGQSTYGDLPMHLSFITGLKNAAFPAEYPFYPGHQLSYPFLADSLSTSFYLMGWSLQAATTVPATLMMALCYMGVMLLAREMTAGKKTIVLAALLFFLNGGLGFLYDFDQAAGLQNFVGRLRNILEGYYKTPTNQPDPNNLRWSNVIVDLMVPQRTLLGGWCMAIPCFYLLYTAFAPETRRAGDTRATVLLGIWAGALPLIHTHSFLALGLCTAGMMVYDLIHDKARWQLLRQYLLYGGIAVVLAAPQLFGFTFAQAFQDAGAEGGGNTFLKFQFNWVNNPGGSGMRDFYLWFYVKNIGLPVIALILALCERNARHRRIFAGALAIILAAETIRFQPNEYDNNKLLYLAWMLCCMIVADWCAMIWRRMKGLRARPVIAVMLAVVTFLSAGLTIWRECVSDYQAFSTGAVQVGEFARDETEEGSLFLTGTHHLNPVASIGGRRIVCGPDLWLYYHGFDTTERKLDIRRFYTDPAGNTDVLTKYDVDYILVSSYERSDYIIDYDALNEMYTVVFENGEATVYAVPEG